MHCFICEGARATDNTNLTRPVDVTWHDSHLAFARLDNSWTVWSNQPRLVLAYKCMFHTHHVLLWNPLCDAHDESDFSFECLHNGACSCWWWDVDNSCIAVCCLLCLHRIFK